MRRLFLPAVFAGVMLFGGVFMGRVAARYEEAIGYPTGFHWPFWTGLAIVAAVAVAGGWISGVIVNRRERRRAAEDASVREVCEAFDCGLLADIGDADRIVYALGYRAELAAGLRGGTVTDWFDSTAALARHVHRNREALLAEARRLSE